MRITQETDYAFRICSHLARNENKVIGASIIAKEEAIPERFTLRILRKLNIAGITKSKRGVTGGYLLNKSKEKISLYDIIVAIEGPIVVNKCLDQNDPHCSKHTAENCKYPGCKIHRRLENIQSTIIEMFKESKLDKYL